MGKTYSTSGPSMPNVELRFRDPPLSTKSFGMTLRDYFAAQALVRLITWEDGAIRPACDAALMAYDYADAMLKEREK